MSALRRALLGSVFLFTAHTVAGGVIARTAHAADTADTADTGESGTAWADSVNRALAARAAEEGGSTDFAPAEGQLSQQHISYQHGVASWYGGRFHHRRTSSGALFDKHTLTAAHPTAPLGSKLLVTSEETGRSVVVTVNDRGPYSRGRVIDLSRAAAAQIGMLGSGVAHVRIATATPEEVAAAPESPAVTPDERADNTADDMPARTPAATRHAPLRGKALHRARPQH
ncbi:septal ring lytic transglycosylase RlpA family protein [Acetobacter sp. TBRC 12305]|uniref:Endolytic peptidoglycan transglycosylase RlpA n=1 Tax=Acetobacter garciniae TaxID=2817435 RepID=A0A939KLX5_9PROT|nr:septal ring lytic transglycosylase RlpA family protein [Acetobacter garciniae]MBO1324683.1 septal ring lytic transglycosylase RlpA family protein [Acetobacter garciniae]MBX0344373.1 septal ring lytic transglycosylase RlpA family protein [Acetobacter garciniae]